MSKLRLHLEDLAVDSFETMPQAVPERGTVDAHASAVAGTCPVRYCTREPTEANTCWNTCDDPSCAPTCAYTCDDYTCAYTCEDPSYYTCIQYCGSPSQGDTCPGYCPV